MRCNGDEALVLLVMQALPLLSSAVLLLLIFIFLFGVAGIQLFQDAAHQTCSNNVDGSYPDPALTENSDEWGCGHRHCPSNYTCTVSLCLQFFFLKVVIGLMYKATPMVASKSC